MILAGSCTEFCRIVEQFRKSFHSFSAPFGCPHIDEEGRLFISQTREEFDRVILKLMEVMISIVQSVKSLLGIFVQFMRWRKLSVVYGSSEIWHSFAVRLKQKLSGKVEMFLTEGPSKKEDEEIMKNIFDTCHKGNLYK